MAILKPYKILSTELSSLPIVEGQFIITTDDKKVYLDNSEGERVELYANETEKLSYITDGATKVEASTQNGYIVINGVETKVYTASSDANTTYKLSKSGSSITLTGSDGSTTSVTDTDTTYGNMVGSSTTVDGESGLVPAPGKGSSDRYLNSQGGWTVPTDTTYEDASETSSGLMTAEMVTKLNSIDEGAQVNTVTGVKGSSETSYRTGDINITKANIGLGNVDNKSSETIRSEITKSNVTTALGYTPPETDTDTTYGLSIKDNTVSLVEGGTSTSVTIPDNNTTYTLTQDSTDKHKLTLTPSSGTATTITVPDNNTTYGLSISGNTITLVEGGSTKNVTVPDNNTTYTLTQDSTDANTIILTSSTGEKTTITIPGDEITASAIIEALGYTPLKTETTYTLTQDSTDGHKITLTPSSGTATTITIPDNNTTYSAGTGIGISGTTISNIGVRSISTGSSNGTISVNTNGTSADVAVKGLGSLAYKSSLSASDVSAVPTSSVGVAGGVASLDDTGLVPSSQLPSYVDDTIEGYYSSGVFYKDSSHTTAITGESGKIYVDLDTNKIYRWSGSTYVVISDTITLGTTSSTAFRGDYGNTAYTHAATNKGAAFESGLYKITTNSEGHVTAATAVAKSDITALGIPSTNTTYSVATQTANGLMSSTDKVKLDEIEEGATANTASTTTPLVAGTAAVGTDTGFARGDHVHPAQTTVSGNAGSATKLATARTIAISGGATGTATSFNGTANITIPVTSLDATKLTGTASIDTTGNAATATKATQDSAGQDIADTYIKGLSVSGKTITYTKGDGDTGTITTQDTTYSTFVKSGSSAASGLVPAPSTTAGTTKFLREDGTWTVPPDTNTWTKVSTTADGYISQLSGSSSQWLDGTGAWSAPTASSIGALASTTKYALSSSVGGDATKAVQLTTARTIDGVNFNGTAAISHYGTCDTAAATTAKVVACDNFVLVTGARIIVKFTVTNTGAVASLTLNVNSTGAISIKYRNGNLPSTSTLTANRIYEFVYDGTYYQLVGDLDTNSNTTYSAGTGLSLSSNTFSLAASGVTAGTAGPTANVTGSNGSTISVPSLTVDEYGRVTALTSYTFTAQNTNTNYYPTTWAWTAGTTSGPTATLSGSGMSSISVAAIPSADGTTASGIVTTGAQTFGGVKTFSSAPKLSTNTITTSGGYTVTIPNATSTLATLATSQALTNKTYNGYTLAAACAKGVDTSITASTTSTNVPTSAAVASLVSSLSGCTTTATSLTCTLPDSL